MSTASEQDDTSAAPTAPRSYLFVPGDRPERYAKALASGADAVIIDLEDAVAPHAKAIARDALRDAWAELRSSARILVRMTAVGAATSEDDLALLADLAPRRVLVPKTEHAHELIRVRDALAPETKLLPMIESARGWQNLESITGAAGVERLVFGSFDFQADLGMDTEHEVDLLPVRLAIVAHSRLADLDAPVDGVTLATDDEVRVRDDAALARRLGFSGKLCIHPRQVAAVHAAFAPSARELAWAERILEAASSARGGAVMLDGRMIDRPIVLRAQRMLARQASNIPRSTTEEAP